MESPPAGLDILEFNETRLKEFYVSDEPETTCKFPLSNYTGGVTINNWENRELQMCLRRDAQAGDILLIENSLVSCACFRCYASYTDNSYTHAPRTLWFPPSPRIPQEVQRHLASKFANGIQNFVGDYEPLVRRLDARRHTPGVIHGSTSTSLGHDNRGPWKTAGVQVLDLEKVWSIVGNNAMCAKVRSKSQEEPTLVETCDLWGLWVLASFINHSCSPNCHQMRVGNAMIIRAAVNITAGAEITLPYFDIFEPLWLREAAAETWGFRCECRRCAFERSIGQPYDIIQADIVNLKRQIQNAWTLQNVEISRRVADRLFEKMASHVVHVEELISKLRQRLQDQTNRDNQVSLQDLNQMRNRVMEGWINASFIEPFIAFYTLCQTRSSCLPGPSSFSISPPITCRSVDAMQVRWKILSLDIILQALSVVNPGNLLGQEFYSIILKASNELIKCDLDENFAANLDLSNKFFDDAIQFYCRYYGFPGMEVLGTLMKTRS